MSNLPNPIMGAIYEAVKDRPYGEELAKLLTMQLPRDWEYRFELTDKHIALLRRLVVFYDYSSMLGAPAVSKSRPYGNSAILSDIAEIVGIKEPDWEKDETWSDDDLMTLLKWHYETTRALEVFLAVGKIELGIYARTYAFENWKKEGNA